MTRLNHVSRPADTPCRASHAIFVREGAAGRFEAVNTVPAVMRRRLLSLRAFDGEGMMLDADIVGGKQIEAMVERMFRGDAVAGTHVHSAKPGCFPGRGERAGREGTAA